MIDFLKGTVGKDYFSDRLYGCQECIAEYLASEVPLNYCWHRWHLAFKSKELFQASEVPTQCLDLQPQSQIQYAMGTNASMRLEVSYAWVGRELELNSRLKELPFIPCY